MGSYFSTPEPPKKVSYFKQPESVFDALPVWNGELPSWTLENNFLSIEDLFLGDPAEVGHKILVGLQEKGFVVLKSRPQDLTENETLLAEMRNFFLQSSSWKEKYACSKPDDKGTRVTASGYSCIQFDNRESVRDPEERDVFQIRLSEWPTIPWPSASFQHAALASYHSNWTVAVRVLHLLAAALKIDPQKFLSLLRDNQKSETSNSDGESKGVEACPTPEQRASQNSNLCLFRYADDKARYTNEQRCMVHQDHGLVTLIPPPTGPGLQALCWGEGQLAEHWWPVGEMVQGATMLYCGLALQRVTRGLVPALVHRVVRQPKMERYSSPFELKVNDNARLEFAVANQSQTEVKQQCPATSLGTSALEHSPSPGREDEILDGKQFEIALNWESIQRKVSRTNFVDDHA